MKLLALLFFVLFAANAGWSQSILTFERIFVKVDTTVQNSNHIQKIKFMNTGNKPLVITSCTPELASDKCTFDKKAVAPGNSAYISYQPDASGCGKYNRNITVTTKDGESVILHLKGVVVCAPESKKPAN